MISRSAAAFACLLLSTAALAQQDPTPPAAPGAPAPRAAKKPPTAKQRAAAKKALQDAKAARLAAEKAKADAAAAAAAASAAAAESAAATARLASTPPPPPAPAAPPFDTEEFRRQVMEEVRKELQKTKDEVKQETAWVEADSTARVQDSEAVERLKQSVNLFQPHGYFRVRYEFFNDLNEGRAADPAGYNLFPNGFINSGNNKSISDANMRFRFDPTFMISEDLQLHATFDILDNVLLGSSPQTDPFLDQYTPLSALTSGRAAAAVNVKRVWGRVNTQLGEFTVGRMGYHFGLGILHNDGNCLDCDYGDTYDRVAFSPREFKGHRLTIMMDILDKGASTTGEYGDLGRSVDIDTLDDGYRIALELLRVDTAEEARRKLDAGEWVINYGATVDYRVQGWDTPGQVSGAPVVGISGGYTVGDSQAERDQVVQRSAKLYQPDAFFSLRKDRFKLEAEIATTFGNVGTRSTVDVGTNINNPGQTTIGTNGTLPLQFGQVGAALQSQLAFLPGDAVILGLDAGGASGDKGVYGFGARPWRSGTGADMGVSGVEFRATGPGDIDGPHFSPTHGHINNFIFNRAFNVDMILWRNLVTAVTSGWYVKPSLRYRPTGRKSGGGDDTGFEITAAVIYSQAWYDENTPGLSKPLGLEANLGVSYDTSDRLHVGLMYGVLLPLSGLSNTGLGYGAGVTQTSTDGSITHAVRAMVAMPF